MAGASAYPTRPTKPACNWDEVSGEDLSLKAGYGITVSDKVVSLADTAAEFNGVLIDGGEASGDPVGYVNEGRIHVFVNANSDNISEGDFGKVTTGGIFILAEDENDEYVLKFLEAADGDGEYILADLEFKGHINLGTESSDVDKYTLHTEIADPGDGAAIPVTASGIVHITTAAAETNTLAIPTFEGQLLCLFCEVYAVGDRVVTVASAINQTGNTQITLGAAEDMIILIAIDLNGTLYWRVLQNDGAALA